jgi:hypothetical protein
MAVHKAPSTAVDECLNGEGHVHINVADEPPSDVANKLDSSKGIENGTFSSIIDEMII